MLEQSSEVYIYEVQHFPLFQQIYNVGTFCMEKIMKSEDCTNMLSGDTFIRTEVVGKFNKDDLNLISEGKGELTKTRIIEILVHYMDILNMFLL